ncbi:MAG TPA: hypothetical protein VFH96_09300 [Pyrinomonadaceae bacterium]|nr:hypothetical protein [Pyrinomonadaceae bacterium]
MFSTKLILAYWRERYPVSVFVPFAILIAAAGIAAGGSLPTARDVITSCVLAYTLILVFRILDDLADLTNDRRRYPSRVLVQSSDLTPIMVLAFLIAAADVLIILWQPQRALRLIVLAAVSIFLALWYLLRMRFRAGPLVSAHLILIKYPVISLLTCTNWERLTVNTALPLFGTVYLGICIYEQLHDRAVRESRGGSWVFAAEAGLLACLPLLMLLTGGFLR